MPVLTPQQRKALEQACTSGRRASEQAVRAALESLAILAERPPAHLDKDDRRLRRGLRAKARQLGDKGDNLDLLIAECAYEQWHRLLFARFLAENNLLIHPEYRAPVTLDDCDELAESLGEADGWSVAARFAAEILPGIFRLDDPCIRLRLASEGRLALEVILGGLPSEIFEGDDALGWVYQFWQKDKKDEVNASDRKIGQADLGPVTQLFTENYMVRFLLENTLGAWWARRHPTSQLVGAFRYLRLNDAGLPDAGSFSSWPDSAAEVTVMDPCCGSGHFLVEALSMLSQMRAEEEGLSIADAQDAVLRDNLFGLELDPRCVQIAIFAVALHAWKVSGGWRALMVPHIACSGIPVRASVDEWRILADGNPRIEGALVRLHVLFREADSLGSLIDARRSSESSDPIGLQPSLEDVEWEDLAPLVAAALGRETQIDPAGAVLGADATGLARAADLLSRRYWLLATNVPFLASGRFSTALTQRSRLAIDGAEVDLATVMMDRARAMSHPGGALAVVTPQNWTTAMPAFEKFRRSFGETTVVSLLARLGPGAFSNITGEVVQPALVIAKVLRPDAASTIQILDRDRASAGSHASWLRESVAAGVGQLSALARPGSALTKDVWGDVEPLASLASAFAGAQTGDDGRYRRFFWELPDLGGWDTYQTSSKSSSAAEGCESVVRLRGPDGAENAPGAVIRGTGAWGKSGLAVARTSLNVSTYAGGPFNDSITVLVPHNPDDLVVLWAYAKSDEFAADVRSLSKQVKVGNKIFEKLPLDAERFRELATDAWPDGVPMEVTLDATQWGFNGRPERSKDPLQVAVSRLLGYRWPEQHDRDNLDQLSDADGIVCLPSLMGEAQASERVEQVLATAYGTSWSPGQVQKLLDATGSKKATLRDWLRDDFFRQHCALFAGRPFVWHIWDGQPDGFAALVNYHRLDRKLLEKLTYTYLGDWIERQRSETHDDVAGAEGRLAAATKLRGSLELILDGEPPYDVYVRWKSLAKQAIGWEPDLNDGVRLNARPFVRAGVLRSNFNVRWDEEDDCPFTTSAKRAARGGLA